MNTHKNKPSSPTNDPPTSSSHTRLMSLIHSLLSHLRIEDMMGIAGSTILTALVARPARTIRSVILSTLFVLCFGELSVLLNVSDQSNGWSGRIAYIIINTICMVVL